MPGSYWTPLHKPLVPSNMTSLCFSHLKMLAFVAHMTTARGKNLNKMSGCSFMEPGDHIAGISCYVLCASIEVFDKYISAQYWFHISMLPRKRSPPEMDIQ